MAKYRKKPVVVEAALYDGERVGDVIYEQGGAQKVAKGSRPIWFPAFVQEIPNLDRARVTLRKNEVGAHGSSLFIGTLAGVHEAKPGDWIIRGIKGELYPCKPDIFARTYERAD